VKKLAFGAVGFLFSSDCDRVIRIPVFYVGNPAFASLSRDRVLMWIVG
jgi:hypothetical protein